MLFFKQRDPKWSNKKYAGETMGAAGCGPTACACLTGETPDVVADWLTAHGYASDGSGTYHSGIVAYFKNMKYKCIKLDASYNGKIIHKDFDQLKNHLKNGNMAILLMGGTSTGCVSNYWCYGGHYIAVSEIKDNKLYTSDPWTSDHDGYIPWDKFAGNIKKIFLIDKKEEDYMTGKKVASIFNYEPVIRKVHGYIDVHTAPDANSPLLGDYPHLGNGNSVRVLVKLDNNYGLVVIADKYAGWVDCKNLYK